MPTSPVSVGPSISQGLWKDYESDKTYILLSDDLATIFPTLLAVVLALSLSWADRIVRRVLFHFVRWLSSPEQQIGSDPELQPLNGSSHSGSYMHTSTTHAPNQDVIALLQAPGGGRPMLKAICRNIWQFGIRRNILSVFVGLVVFATWVGRIIPGIYTAKIVAERQALWQSDHCGIWEFDSEGAGEEAATRADVYDREKEARAGEYARYCFEDPTVTGNQVPQRLCDFFTHQNITYTKTLSYDCPFADKSVCITGTQSVTFDTGLVGAMQIGINDKVTYKFRRSATCAPLNNDYPFVQNTTNHNTTTFFYHYGDMLDWDDVVANFTFTTTNNPFDTRVPAYDLRTQATSWDREDDAWRPIRELTTPENTTITIFLVSPLHIYYLRSSDDPIFGVREECQVDDYEPPFYCRKSDPKARLFACIDRHELCDPSGKSCWSVSSEDQELKFGAINSPGYWLMKLSLYSSNMYEAIVRQLGNALIAQERVSQFISTPLPRNHWVAEVERIFASSLARIQFDAWEIASGVNRQHEGEDGYVEYTPKEAGNMCGLYKFKSAGYKNVNAAAFFSLLLGVPFSLWIMTRTLGGLSDTGSLIVSVFQRTTPLPDAAPPAPGEYGATLGTTDRHLDRLTADSYDDEPGWGNDSEDLTSELSEEGVRGTSGTPDTTRGSTLLAPDRVESGWDPEELLFCWLFTQLFLGLHWLWRKVMDPLPK